MWNMLCFLSYEVKLLILSEEYLEYILFFKLWCEMVFNIDKYSIWEICFVLEVIKWDNFLLGWIMLNVFLFFWVMIIVCYKCIM